MCVSESHRVVTVTGFTFVRISHLVTMIAVC